MLRNCKPPNPMLFEYVFLWVLPSLDLVIRSPNTSSQMIEAKSKKGRRDECVNVSLNVTV